MPALAPPPAEPPAKESPPAGVDKSGDRVKAMFAAIAGRYDRMNHLLSGGVDYYWRWLVSRAPVGDGPVLDCCTGTGDLAFAFRKKHPGVRVVGADFTHDMLTLAGRKNRGRGVSFVEGDSEALPFPADTFTAVSVAFGLRNVADTRRGLAEMTRVAAPGGRVLILEFSRPTNPLFAPVYRQYFKHVLPRVGRLLARNDEAAYDYLPDSVAEFPDGDALCELMRDAGLQDCAFRPLTLGVATLYTGRKPADG